MATVDFTLEDVRGVVHDEVEVFKQEILNAVGQMIDDSLGEFRTRLDAVETKAKSTRTLVDQHSVDIMNLRAKTA